MNLSDYRKSILTKRMLLSFSKNFLASAGALSIFLGIVSVQIPGEFQYGWWGIGAVVLLSALFGLFLSLPRKSFSVQFQYPDVNIGISTGDILDGKENIVLGFSDTFDTEIGDIISAASLQGQFLSHIYDNDRQRLDNDLKRSLTGQKYSTDSAKTQGKNKRFKIGTVAVLQGEGRKFFCCAYSKMGNDLKASADINCLWDALNGLWSKIRLSGEQRNISIPVIGTNLARVPGISYAIPIKIIILSFLVNSRIESIAKQLTIVIRESDLGKVDLLEIKEFVEALDR